MNKFITRCIHTYIDIFLIHVNPSNNTDFLSEPHNFAYVVIESAEFGEACCSQMDQVPAVCSCKLSQGEWESVDLHCSHN